MKPRERVLNALNHQSVDRTPCDFWAEEPTWRRLLDYLGHNDRARALDELGIDIRHLAITTPPERLVDGNVYQNYWGERYVYQPTPWGKMREDVKGALSNASAFSDLESFEWPSPDGFDYSSLNDQCHRNERYALLYGFADVWQRPALVRGWEGMFLDMVERPDWVHYLARKFAATAARSVATVDTSSPRRIYSNRTCHRKTSWQCTIGTAESPWSPEMRTGRLDRE
jgi:uroporphyrinogen decarboxylase